MKSGNSMSYSSTIRFRLPNPPYRLQPPVTYSCKRREERKKKSVQHAQHGISPFTMQTQSPHTSSTALILLCILSEIVSGMLTETTHCYFPDGSISWEGYICNLTAVANRAVSPCCRLLDACMEDGTCLQPYNGWFYRFSCTDSTFEDPACSRACIGTEGVRKSQKP